MNNKTIGVILLSMAGLCTIIDLAVDQISNAFISGMIYLGGKGGSMPKSPSLDEEALLIVIILATIGAYFLFKRTEPSQ